MRRLNVAPTGIHEDGGEEEDFFDGVSGCIDLGDISDIVRVLDEEEDDTS